MELLSDQRDNILVVLGSFCVGVHMCKPLSLCHYSLGTLECVIITQLLGWNDGYKKESQRWLYRLSAIVVH